jgi:hypothetical protein
MFISLFRTLAIVNLAFEDISTVKSLKFGSRVVIFSSRIFKPTILITCVIVKHLLERVKLFFFFISQIPATAEEKKSKEIRKFNIFYLEKKNWAFKEMWFLEVLFKRTGMASYYILVISGQLRKSDQNMSIFFERCWKYNIPLYFTQHLSLVIPDTIRETQNIDYFYLQRKHKSNAIKHKKDKSFLSVFMLKW